MRDVEGARNGVDDVEGAKAGNKQKKPYRAAVSATSSQTMRIKYGLSEGTILGFGRNASYDDMLKRIFLDGTPIMSAEGEKLLDVLVEFRDGSQEQEPISGLPSISVEHEVGVEVRLAAPVSRSFSRKDTTSFDVRISVPQLYAGNADGDSYAGRIEFKIDVSTNGGAFAPAGTFVITEKILNGYTDTFNIEVPQGDNHVVRVSRITPEIVNDYAVNKLVVDAIIENTDIRLRYSNTAVLYLEYDAEQFNNVPKIEIRIFGKSDILVPANYNTETRQYATAGAGTTGGVWNGTWKRDYTDNPVWIWLDTVTAPRYGLGDKISLDMINKWELYGIAQYCDQLVSDGKGGQEPRFTCNNMYLQKGEDAFRVLKDLAASFRAKTVWDGEFITLLADTPRDAVMTFSNANIKDLTYASTQDSAQRNLINVQYYDRDNKFASDIVMHRSTSNILSRGKVVDGNFTALGCTSQGQAQRIASYVMNSELYETELASFTTGLEGSIPRLNDVVYLADSSIAGRVIGGRVAAVAGRVITLDRKVPVEVQVAPSTQLVINQEIKKTQPISVVAISADRLQVTLASDPPAGTEAGLVWALLTQDLVPQKFTITDIKFQPDDMTFAISALQYNDSKYAAIDGSARIVVPPISVVEYEMLRAPLTVISSYIVRIIQDASACDIDVSWAQSRNAVQYQLEMQKEGSEWRIVGRFQSFSTRLENMYTGTYTFRVCAYDSLGNASPYTYSDPILVAGKVLPPPMLTQYNVTGVLFGYKHEWVYPAHTEDSRAVRLRFTTLDPAASPAQQWQYIDIAYPTATFTEQDVSAGLQTWFSAAIVDKYGNVGAYTNWRDVVPNTDPAQVLDLLDGQLTSQQLDQALRTRIELGAGAVETAALAQMAADAASLAAANAGVAANLAQAAADDAKTAASSAANAVAGEAATRREAVIALNDGLTQETNARTDGDATLLSNIDTYKLSNDGALASVRNQTTVNTDALSSQAEQLTQLDAGLTDTAQLLSSNIVRVNDIDGKVESHAEQLTNINASLQGKADANVLNSLSSTVTEIDGKVVANTQELSAQSTRLANAELGVTNNASAISKTYTKTEADDVIAGKIESYDANLVIGGTNLLLNSDFSDAASSDKWGDNAGGYTKVNDPIYGDVLQTSLSAGGLVHAWVKLENNVEYTYSALVKPSNDLNMISDAPLHYWAGKDNQPQGKIYVLRASHGRIEAGKWTRISIVFKLIDDADSFRPFIFGLSGVLQLAWTKLERGNKATDWTPNDRELQQSINANANAIQTVNAEVARVNGEVVATTTSVNNLSSNVGLLQGSINEVRQTVTNNQESTNTLVTSLKSGMADADDVSMMMRNATVLFEDLTFREGYNGVATYNNHYNGALVANFTDKLPDNPVASTRQLQFIHTGGATTPSLGGFSQGTFSRANGVFLVKFVAKLPVRFSFDLAANAYGDGANGYFIGSSEGTGRFKTYYAVYRCGATGNFSSIGYVYVNGQHPTPENPLIWYLASSTVYDCLDNKVAPDSVVNGIAEAKSTASTAVNKAEATALIAQNLQVALDNTNATISNDYYTRGQADDKSAEIAAGKIESYDASLVIGGVNTYDNLTTPVSGLVGSPQVPYRNSGDTPNGFYLIGDSTGQSAIRLEGVITEAGWWTISFYIRGSQNTPVGFKIDIVDGAEHTVRTNSDNTWKYVQFSSYVNYVDSSYHFIDFTEIWWSYIFLKDIKVERGRKATAWTPSNQHVLGSLSANASAIQSTTAEVQRIDGVVTTQARQVTTLESSKSAIENGAIAGNDEYIVDLRDPAYNRDLYYPVLLSSFSTEYRQAIRVMSTLNAISIPSWASHGGGFSLNAQFQMGGAGWGTIDPEVVTDNFSFSFTHWSISPLDQIGQIIESSQPFFYVRGGGYYRLSKPVNRSVQVCAPNGSLSGYHAGVLYPRPYQASTVPKSINQGLNQQNVKLQQTNEVVNGVKAVSTVTVDNNGVMSGYGLISELVNGQVTSAFGVNADTFFIGAPASGKKPFVVLTGSGAINGVVVPAGTYIDTAFIADLTVTSAKIADLGVTNAKIDNLAVDGAKIANAAITTAKIGDLQVDTLKIANRAVTVPITIEKTGITPFETNYTTGKNHTVSADNWFTASITGLSANSSVIVFISGFYRAYTANSAHHPSNTYAVSSTRLNLKVNGNLIRSVSSSGSGATYSSSQYGSSQESLSVFMVQTDSSGNLNISFSSVHNGNVNVNNMTFLYGYSATNAIIHVLELKK